MSEEINNQAVELSDEEMDSISGGKALIVMSNTDYKWVIACDHKKVNAEEFRKRNFSETISNRCGRFDGSGESRCSLCKHYHHLGSAYLGTLSDTEIINRVKSTGYGDYSY